MDDTGASVDCYTVVTISVDLQVGDLLRTTHRVTTYCVLIYSVDNFSAGITYEQTVIVVNAHRVPGAYPIFRSNKFDIL